MTVLRRSLHAFPPNYWNTCDGGRTQWSDTGMHSFMRGTAIPHRWWGSCLCGGFRYIYYEMFTTCAALQQRFTTIVSCRELIHAVHIGWFWVGPVNHSQHGYIPPVTHGMYKMLDWQKLMSSPSKNSVTQTQNVDCLAQWRERDFPDGFTASQPEDLTFYRHTVIFHTLFQGGVPQM